MMMAKHLSFLVLFALLFHATNAFCYDENNADNHIQKAGQAIEKRLDIEFYVKALNHPDPHVRAETASGLEGLGMRQYDLGIKLTADTKNRLAEMALKDEPLVGIEAAAAYFRWWGRDSERKESLGKIFERVVDFLDNENDYIRDRAIAICDEFSSIAPQDVGVLSGYMDALVRKIKTTQRNEIRSKARYFLGKVSYFSQTNRALKFMVEDAPSAGDYGSAYSAYKIITLLKAKEYVPLLKKQLQAADKQQCEQINATLMKLGVDVYAEDDFSSPNRAVTNFWKAIDLLPIFGAI